MKRRTIALALIAVFGFSFTTSAYSQALFFSEDGNSNGLYMLDRTTGAATNVGESGVTNSNVGLAPSGTSGLLFGTEWMQLLSIAQDGSGHTDIGGDGQEGLAYDSGTGTLYGSINDSFHTVDPGTGNNQTALALPAGDPDLEGIAFGNGGVYALQGGGSSDTNLYFYDPATDSWSVVGDTGINWTRVGLAFDTEAGVLYAKQAIDSNLYRVDPATGSAIVVGDTGLAEGGGLAFVEAADAGAGSTPIPLAGWPGLVLMAILLMLAPALVRIRA